MANELQVKEFSALPVADDGKTLLYTDGEVKQSSKNLSEMLTDEVNNKLDTTAFSTVSGSFLTAHQVIPSGKWENVSNVVIANSATWETETDWSDDINEASAYAYEQAIAQIPDPFDPTFLSGEIDKKLDEAIYEADSGKFLTAHQSLEGYLTKSSGDEYYQPKGNYVTDTQLEITSGEIVSQIPSINGLATETLVQNVSGEITALIPTNYYPDNNPSGFITGVDLTPYQTISGMTAYQLAGDYATTNYVNEEVGKIGSYVTATLVNGEPDVQNPSNKKIYLTKIDGATEPDLYKEWIYTESSAWECIGDTSMNLSGYVTYNTFNTTTNYLSGAIDYVSANAKDVLYVKIIPGPGAGTLDTNYATISEAINNGKIVVVQDFDTNLYYYYSTRYGNGNIYFTTTYTKAAANTLTVNEIYIKNTQETHPTIYRDLSKTYDFNNYATTSQLETVSSNITSMIPSTEGLASETFVESVSGEIVDKIPDVFIITNDIEQKDIPISEDLSYFYKDKYGNLYPLVDKYDVTATTASKYTTYVFRGITDNNLIKEYHAYVVSSKINLVEDCVYEYNKTVYGGKANYIPFSYIVEMDRAVGANYPTVNSSVSSSGINVKFIWPNDPSLTAEGWPETPTGNLQLNNSEYEWSNSGNMYYIDHYIQGIETIKNQNILLTISSEYGELITTGGPYVEIEQWGYFNCVDVTATPDFYIEYQNTNFNILTGTNNFRFHSIQSITGDADIQNIYSGTMPEKSDYLFRNNYYFVLPDMSYSDRSKPLHFKCINYFKQDTGDVLTDGDNLVGLKIGDTNYTIPDSPEIGTIMLD